MKVEAPFAVVIRITAIMDKDVLNVTHMSNCLLTDIGDQGLREPPNLKAKPVKIWLKMQSLLSFF